MSRRRRAPKPPSKQVLAAADQILHLTPSDEATCEQCNTRKLAEFIGGPGHSLYTLQITNPDQLLTWDVGKARALVADRGAEPERISAGQALAWVHEFGNVDQGHLMHLPESALDEPILLDAINIADRPGAPIRGLPVIIDGTHRIIRCILARKTIYGIWLTPEEHHACISTTAGRVDELVR